MQNAKNKKKVIVQLRELMARVFFTDLVIVYVHCICECL